MKFRHRSLLGLVALLVSTTAFAQSPPDCKADPDACVRSVIAENLVFADECGQIFPGAKKQIDGAAKDWSVLTLPIPRLREATDPQGALQAQFRKLIGPYLRKAPNDEPDIECEARFAMMKSPAPQLRGDSAELPADVLKRYAK